ncbi:hypothetical protein D9M68_811820 [compost metagenome]
MTLRMTKVLPLTEPSRLVATITAVSPTLTFMPRASSSGMTIWPFSTRAPPFGPSAMRPGSRGAVAASRAGSTPLMRMLVVSLKLLNMPPNLTRGDQVSTALSCRSASSTLATAAGFMFRFSGSVSMDAT